MPALTVCCGRRRLIDNLLLPSPHAFRIDCGEQIRAAHIN